MLGNQLAQAQQGQAQIAACSLVVELAPEEFGQVCPEARHAAEGHMEPQGEGLGVGERRYRDAIETDLEVSEARYQQGCQTCFRFAAGRAITRQSGS